MLKLSHRIHFLLFNILNMSSKIKLEQTDVQPSEPIAELTEQEVVENPQGKSKTPWMVLLAVIIVIVAIGFIFKDKLGIKSQRAAVYQAVFLSNGQVYFGKLSDVNDTYVTLKNIYYLQVVQQQQQQLQGQQALQAGQSPQVSLVKLGNELHGPVDVMRINRNQILFYEDLKQDSQVVTAIKDYVQKPQNPVAPAVQPQTPPAQPAPVEAATGTPAK